MTHRTPFTKMGQATLTKPRLEIGEILLQFHISGRRGDSPLHGLDSIAEAGLCVLIISHTLESLTHFVMSNGEPVLPADVGRIGCHEALGDGEVFLVRGQRVVEASLGWEDITEKSLRAADPRRMGCAACKSRDVVGFGLELGAFSAPTIADLQRRE